MQAWDNFEFFFYLNQNLICPWSIFEKHIDSFPSNFAKISMFKHFRGDWAYAEPYFFGELSKNFYPQNFHFGPVRCVPTQFSKISISFGQNLHFNLVFLSNFLKLYHAHAEHAWKQFYCTLSIRGNNIIAHWAYVKRIFAYAQPAEKF